MAPFCTSPRHFSQLSALSSFAYISNSNKRTVSLSLWFNMNSLQVPTCAGWPATAPPLPTAAFPENLSSFPFPPSRPTVHDGDDEEATDIEETCSEDDSYDGSEAEEEHASKPTTPDSRGPGDVVTIPANGMAQERPETDGPPKSPGLAASLDMFAEIRKMIKEECTKPPSLCPATCKH